MFYNKSLTLVKKDNTQLIVDENGIPTQVYTVIKEFKGDVQPVSRSRVRREYGDYENFNYEIFVNEAMVDIDTINYKVEYNGRRYDILSLTVWDDKGFPYTQMLVGINE